MVMNIWETKSCRYEEVQFFRKKSSVQTRNTNTLGSYDHGGISSKSRYECIELLFFFIILNFFPNQETDTGVPDSNPGLQKIDSLARYH